MKIVIFIHFLYSSCYMQAWSLSKGTPCVLRGNDCVHTYHANLEMPFRIQHVSFTGWENWTTGEGILQVLYRKNVQTPCLLDLGKKLYPQPQRYKAELYKITNKTLAWVQVERKLQWNLMNQTKLFLPFRMHTV